MCGTDRKLQGIPDIFIFFVVGAVTVNSPCSRVAFKYNTTC